GAVHTPVDVQDIDCDFYGFTGHKLYGPTGIGVLYGKKEWLDRMPPFLGGGSMIEGVALDHITYSPPPTRFEAGTPPIIEAVGLAAAIDYVTSVGLGEIVAHEHELLAYAEARLREFNWLKAYGTAKGKGSIVSFSVDGLHPHDVSTIIDR